MGILIAIQSVFLAGFMFAALGKRWFPKASATIALICLCGLFLAFLPDVVLDAVNGKVRNYGPGTGLVSNRNTPMAFWGLVMGWMCAGTLGLTASAWTLRKHLKGQSQTD